jgi:hypothetical protein
MVSDLEDILQKMILRVKKMPAFSENTLAFTM